MKRSNTTVTACFLFEFMFKPVQTFQVLTFHCDEWVQVLRIGTNGGLYQQVNERYDSMQVVECLLVAEKDFDLQGFLQ
jgi:hypothetical protein